MAASYWHSTQKRDWLYTRDQLAHLRHKLDTEDAQTQTSSFTRPAPTPLPEPRLFSLFLHQSIAKLAKRLSVRQPVIATAQVYLRRFYLRVPIRASNPYLLLSTALYVACKINECPQNIRIVVGEARTIWQDFIGPDVASLGETEFWLISTMGCELIVHHPYKTLRMLEGRLGLAQDEAGLAMGVVNDSYLTDLPLLCAPHVVAWAAVFMALTLRPAQMQTPGHAETVQRVAEALRMGLEAPAMGAGAGVSSYQMRLHRFLDCLAESEVDLKGVADAVQEMVSLYVLWEGQYKEKEVRDQVGRFVKGSRMDR